MVDIERELRDLARALDLPEAPDLTGRVRERLTSAPSRGHRRALILVAATLVAAACAALAVPQARTSILDWLGLSGVSIERVPTQPVAPERPDDLGLGAIVGLDEARDRAAFDVVVPDGEPDEVRFSDQLPGGQVAFVWLAEDGDLDVLLTEFRANLDREFMQKMAGPDTTIEQFKLNGESAVWLSGAPHGFTYRDLTGQVREETLRLAGPTLLWQRGSVIFRLEGALTRDEAVAFADALE
jgi:hypothetical protein